jgi:type II secretory pathway pseudopilin PulG
MRSALRIPGNGGGVHSPQGFAFRDVLVVLAVLGMLAVLLLPSRRRVGETAFRANCMNNLKQIWLALRTYHDDQGSFPPPYTVDPAGRRLHSWRTLLLPYLERNDLYGKIDLSRPWNDPVNLPVGQDRFHPYRCPSRKGDKSRTGYLVVVASDGVFRWGETTTRDQIRDDLNHTLMVIEVDEARTVPWMEPSDLDEQTLLALTKSSSAPHFGKLQFLAADGVIQAMDRMELAAQARSLVSINGHDGAK